MWTTMIAWSRGRGASHRTAPPSAGAVRTSSGPTIMTYLRRSPRSSSCPVAAVLELCAAAAAAASPLKRRRGTRKAACGAGRHMPPVPMLSSGTLAKACGGRDHRAEEGSQLADAP